jgi:glutathione peroxidase-family protein
VISRKYFLCAVLVIVCLAASNAVFSGSATLTYTDDEPEDAPIVERQLDFQEFRLKTLEGQDFDLRRYASDKKLLIIGFMAGWCKNSNKNGHVLKALYDKYKTRGLGVVIVTEYSNPQEVTTHINRIGIDYPLVVETTTRNDRKKSSHYRYRREVKDKRKWGTPFYVIVERQNIEPAGSVFARRIYTVSGEIIQAEAEAFIDQRLSSEK